MVIDILKGLEMLYRPDHLLKQAKQQSQKAWDNYIDSMESDSCYRSELLARDIYINAHNKVTAISREIKKRDKTLYKLLEKATAAAAI